MDKSRLQLSELRYEYIFDYPSLLGVRLADAKATPTPEDAI